MKRSLSQAPRPSTTAPSCWSSPKRAPQAPADLPEKSTLLERPAEDGGAFAQLVGRYAALLDSGRPPADAWREAIEAGGWEPASE